MSMWRIWRSLRPATLLEKRLWNTCFPVNFAKFLRTPFFIEHHRTTVSVFYRVGWIFMESSHPGRWGGQLYRALGDLKFSPTLGGGAYPNERFKVFYTFEGGATGFSLLGEWGVSLEHWPKICSSLPYEEVPPSRLPVPNLDKKCVRLSDSTHFHETLTKIDFLAKTWTFLEKV